MLILGGIFGQGSNEVQKTIVIFLKTVMWINIFFIFSKYQLNMLNINLIFLKTTVKKW